MAKKKLEPLLSSVEKLLSDLKNVEGLPAGVRRRAEALSKRQRSLAADCHDLVAMKSAPAARKPAKRKK